MSRSGGPAAGARVLPTVTGGRPGDQAQGVGEQEADLSTTADADPRPPSAGGRPPRHDRAARREALLDAADRAVRRHGAEVSMEAVAAEAGITKPVLYRHFGDREGLLAAVATRHARRLVDELDRALAAEDHPRARIRTTVDTYLAFLERDPELHRFATRLPGTARELDGDSPMRDALGRVCDQVAGAVRAELTAAGLPPSPATTWGEGMVGMVQLVGDRWLDGTSRRDRQQLVAELTDLLWHGFRGIVGRER
jgi:AcrR family transcriptional regulator